MRRDGEMKGNKRNQTCVCTIISKNYLAQARVLAKSYRANNANRKFFVCLVDRIDGFFDPKDEHFELISAEELNIPNFKNICFKYSIMELNTAVKPFFIEYLFNRYNLEKIIYLDPDILITDNLDKLFLLLDKKSILLTPHITAPINDGFKPDELNFLGSGVYNLGFIGLSKSDTTHKLLKWWQKRLLRYCYSDMTQGLFVDQIWLNFAHSFFEGVQVIKEPGYNVAYWNLQERNIDKKGNQFFVNNKPLYFFHFSGFIPTESQNISKYQNRFKLNNLSTATQQLFLDYKKRLITEGYDTIIKWPYAFGTHKKDTSIIQNKSKSAYGRPNTTYQRIFNSKIVQMSKNTFKRAIGINRFEQLKRKIMPIHSKLLKRNYPKKDIINSQNFGVNIFGHLNAENSVGEVARAITKAVQTAGIDYALNNCTENIARKSDDSFENQFTKSHPYPINIFAINADGIEYTCNMLGTKYWQKKYNIAIWNWETEHFSDKWDNTFQMLDEIWVPSSTTVDAIARAANCPVIRIPYPIELQKRDKFDCTHFGIPSKTFVFLFMFDFCSIFERKNPLGLIHAFKKTFKPNEKVMLILKCINHERDFKNFKKMETAAKGYPIKIINKYLSRAEINSLFNVCNCYVSLHRAEGFGLTLAEAMYLGKPVIATQYSSTTDFMNINNSFLVKYTRITMQEDYIHYKKGDIWAEPDLGHAAQLMRFVFDNPKKAQEIGKIAARDIRDQLSPQKVGNMIKQRLIKINEFNH